MKKLILLAVALFGVTATTTTAHADVFNTVKNNTSQAAKMPVPWEKDGHGNDMTLNVINTNQIPYYVSNNNPYVNTIVNAAAGWNDLGVIKFVRVNDPSQSDFDFTLNQNTYQPHVDATTNMRFKNGNYTGASIDITTKNYQTLSKDRQLAVIQHELGHALGFAHDNYLGYDHAANHKIALIMAADNRNKQGLGIPSLGFIEQRALVQHYHLPVRSLTKSEELAQGIASKKRYVLADQ